MVQVYQYVGQFNRVRGGWGSLPPWARTLVLISALPGILIALLSILVLLVSIAALLLLTVPVYRVLRLMTAPSADRPQADEVEVVDPDGTRWGTDGRRQVEARVVDP